MVVSFIEVPAGNLMPTDRKDTPNSPPTSLPGALGDSRSVQQRFSGGARHQPSRSEVPSPGRWKRSDRYGLSDGDDHASSDWSASSSSNPIRWRSCADHGQKSDSAKR